VGERFRKVGALSHKEMQAVRVAKEARLQRQFEMPNAKVDLQ
jgi:hypothetical protein